MTLREIFLENFAGDLEYHPRRAVVYFVLAVAAFCFWIFSPSSMQFTTIPLVFALGSLALLIKGIFLMRKSSEGLGLSDQELAGLSDSSNRKSLPSVTGQASQVVQDFGTGSFLLWPLLNIGKDIDKSWSDPPLFRVFITGAILFLLGWTTRRVTSSKKKLPTLRSRVLVHLPGQPLRRNSTCPRFAFTSSYGWFLRLSYQARQ